MGSGIRNLIAAVLSIGALCAPVGVVAADEGSAGPGSRPDDTVRLAATIDKQIAARWEAEQVTPAPVADDAEFLRRVFLDVGGRIPAVSEVREFLSDSRPDKRSRCVDRLLESPRYLTHFTTVWRREMIPEAAADFQMRFLMPGFEGWLRNRLADNTSYKEMIAELLTVPLNTSAAAGTFNRQGTPTPIAFYQAKQFKPGNLAASIARVFLGLRLECAQCHDHPFDAWKRSDFWGMAAFFAGIERQGQGVFSPVREVFDRRELAIPETDEVVQARFLDGQEPEWKFKAGPRVTLAEWITRRDNPYFARAAVNRLWATFFGIGIVDPPDDFGAANPPSHPVLLDKLARDFADHDFDLKYLIRAITGSRTYQLTSAMTDSSQQDPRLFARMAVRRLSAEQLYESFVQATGSARSDASASAPSPSATSPRAEILEAFTTGADRSTDQQTTVLQALSMMNGKFIADATDIERSATLAAVADYPLLSSAERIETLYLAALGRKPEPRELARLMAYVADQGRENDDRRALGDVFWTLLNSTEFLFNH